MQKTTKNSEGKPTFPQHFYGDANPFSFETGYLTATMPDDSLEPFVSQCQTVVAKAEPVFYDELKEHRLYLIWMTDDHYLIGGLEYEKDKLTEDEMADGPYHFAGYVRALWLMRPISNVNADYFSLQAVMPLNPLKIKSVHEVTHVGNDEFLSGKKPLTEYEKPIAVMANREC